MSATPPIASQSGHRQGVELGRIRTRATDDIRFSTRRGSNDKLRDKRDLRFYGIRDEALCFDVFHDFAGKLELGFAFEAYERLNRDFRDAVLAFDVFEQAVGFTLISLSLSET